MEEDAVVEAPRARTATTPPASTAQKRHQEDNHDYGSLVEGSRGTESGVLCPPQKKVKLDLPGGKNASESDELDEGEIRDTHSDGESFKSVDKAAEDAQEPRQVRWNRGITGGLRTSFMSSGKLDLRKSTEGPAELTHEPLASEAASEASGINPSILEESNPMTDPGATEYAINSQISSSISASISKSDRRKNDRKCRAWFIDWLVAVLPLNEGNPAVVDSKLLLVAYNEWLVSQGVYARKRNNAEIFTDVTPDSNWELPPRVDISGLNITVDNVAGWEALYERWCVDFFSINKSRSVDGKRLRAKDAITSYKRWLKGAPKAMQKAAIKRARITAKGGKIASILALVCKDSTTSQDGRSTSSTNAEHTNTAGSINGQAESPSVLASAPSSILEDNDTSLFLSDMSSSEYLLKYFPGLADSDVFCILCASHGHFLSDCPSAICRFCQDDHPSYACPTRQRCSKCKQIGHSREGCQEKLKLALDERECAICQSKEHAEATCDELWRSFEPDLNAAKKVRLLPVFCYFCGSDGHYGAECGLNRIRASVSRRETWRKASFDLYLDPNSSEVALALQAPPVGAFASTYAADERPDFGGRSIVPQTHVFFEADDEDENEGFIHAPVQKKAKPGNIRFSGRQGTAQQLPPLPPGPPPPPPRSRQQPPASYRQRANAPPPRPAKGNRRRGKGGQRG